MYLIDLVSVSSPFQLGELSTAYFPVSAKQKWVKVDEPLFSSPFFTERMKVRNYFTTHYHYNIVVLPCDCVEVGVYTLILAETSNLAKT